MNHLLTGLLTPHYKEIMNKYYSRIIKRIYSPTVGYKL